MIPSFMSATVHQSIPTGLRSGAMVWGRPLWYNGSLGVMLSITPEVRFPPGEFLLQVFFSVHHDCMHSTMPPV
jgi:fatty acid desaturase